MVWLWTSYSANTHVTLSQISSVDDSKSSAEVNASKALALDHLGLIAAKLRSSTIHARESATDNVALQFEYFEEVHTQTVRYLALGHL